MTDDVQSLRKQVDAFAHGSESTASAERSLASTADKTLAPKPVSRALAAISRHFDAPVSAFAVEHMVPFSDDDADVSNLEMTADAIGLSAAAVRSKPQKVTQDQCPALFADAAAIFVIWSVSGKGKKKTVTVSSFGADASQDDGRRTMPAKDLPPGPGTRVFRLSQPASSGRLHNRKSVRSLFTSPLFSTEAILATIAINLLGLAIPLFTMNVYDRVLPNFSIDTLTVLAVGVAIAAIFDFVLRLLRVHIVDAEARRIDVLFLNRIFGRYLGSAMPKTRRTIGNDVNAFRDTDVIRDFHSSASLIAFGDVPFILIFLGVIAWIAGPLVAISLAAIVAMLLVGLIIQRPLARITEEAYQNTSHRNSVLIETFTGLETLKATGAERHATERWEKAVAAQIRSGVRSRAYTGFALSFMVLVQTLATVALICGGVFMIIDGLLSPGALIAAMIIQGRAMAPVSQVAGLIMRLHQVKAAERALAEIENRVPERDPARSFVRHPGIKGALRFEDVSFSYDEETNIPALKGIDFSIASGERVGIIGASGSGKTTLFKLIAKLHQPDQGRIFLDGVGLNALDPAEVRRHIGWTGADATLFSGTIRDNLTLHAPGATDDDMVEAAILSGALSWINTLPRGFDTVLSEGGFNLSSGQRQTLLLARGLVVRPPLLLLDEPTSDLDGRLEKAVIGGLKKMSRAQTMLVITHRPALFDVVDRVIAIEKGEIVVDGPKDFVLAKLSPKPKSKRQVTVSKGPTVRTLKATG